MLKLGSDEREEGTAHGYSVEYEHCSEGKSDLIIEALSTAGPCLL
jgi:hypothetical protein